MPEASPSTSPRRALVEADLLEHAARLFAAHGYSATSLADIAAAVGLSRPAMYHYVSSKEDLLFRLARQVIDAATGDLPAIARDEATSAQDRLRLFVRRVVDRRIQSPEMYTMLARAGRELPDELANAFLTGHAAVVAELAHLLEAGRQEGKFRQLDVGVAASAIMGMIDQVAWWYPAADGPGPEVVREEIVRLSLAAVAAPGTAVLKAVARVRAVLDDIDSTAP